MCGLYGFNAKKGFVADLQKLKILGICNTQRGIDSCGYYYNGNIKKGAAYHANFLHFITHHDLIPGDLATETFIGHTRKATGGTHTEENAHPFQVENYVQTHNGVIKNIDWLLKNYEIEDRKVAVDSLGLAKIIQARGYDVLNKYEGFAALAFTYTDAPENLYLYHGSSKDKINGKPSEERPLYILHAEEGLYYSSIRESLMFVADPGAKIEMLPHNVVFRIANGEIAEQVYEVNRGDSNVTSAPDSFYFDVDENRWVSTKDSCQINIFAGKIPVVKESKEEELSIICRETFPKERYTKDVYFRQGRYYRGNNILLHGNYTIDINGMLNNDGGEFHFIRGVMMADKHSYEKAIKIIPGIETTTQLNIAYYLSKFSKYPVCTIEGEGLNASGKFRKMWFENGQKYNGEFAPLFTTRKYSVKDGLFHCIIKADSNDRIFMIEGEKMIPWIIDGILLALPPIGLPPVLDTPTSGDEPDLMEGLVSMIQRWADKPLKRSDIEILPEQFLMVIDFMISQEFYRDAIKPVGEAQIEYETTQWLKGLIAEGISLKDSFSESERFKFYISHLGIGECFKPFDLQEVVGYDNRYGFIEFDDTVEEVKEEIVAAKADKNIKEVEEMLQSLIHNDDEQAKQKFILAVDQLVDLEATADNLQALERSDFAQEISYSLYMKLSELKKKMQDLTQEEGFKDLAPQINRIKCL